MTKILNLIKNFKNDYPVTFGLIIFIIIFIFLNKVSKNFLQQTELEKRKIPEFLKIVYGKDNVEDYKIVLQEQTTTFIYKEFVEFSEKKRSGKFTIVSQMGNRCNYNEQSKCNLPIGGKNEIWIFGGSTTFGYGVKNNETISAHLQNLLNNEFNVVNFGTGYYYSTQERILLNNLLTKLNSPYAVVFIDGLNEFYKDYNYHETAYTKLIKHKMNKSSTDDLVDYLNERFNRLNIVRLLREKFFNNKKNNLTKTKNGLDKNELNDMVNILLNNQKIIKAISDEYKFKLVHILQPVPIFNDSYDTSNLPDEYKKNIKKNIKLQKLKEGYDIYLSKNSKTAINLSNFKIKESMYIDRVHYSSKFNLEIAKQIMQNLFKKEN